MTNLKTFFAALALIPVLAYGNDQPNSKWIADQDGFKYGFRYLAKISESSNELFSVDQDGTIRHRTHLRPGVILRMQWFV